ncbi:MAG: Asp-tRNA(Asn)/Glu-tRNA(Gln) amidotransferase subunit GatC [Oscillospiraceae bacterium]|nr:Asp-tRNA(Asn)/Glu-tRNA(Gln) amidotransferase subunit GatC [Oscillospiraceae bacterium]
MSDISKFERMAMLSLADTERDVLCKRFDAVSSSFAKLDEFDTSDVLPLISVLEAKNIMREDITEKIISREELLKNAPEQQDGYIRVPASIDI